jgi:NAD kinase
VELVKNARRNGFLSVDGGKAVKLNMGDVTVVRKSDRETKLIRLNNRSYFDVLHAKFQNH